MSADPITVHVNRAGRGSVAAEPTAVETDRSFELRIRNHGEPVHVHCRTTEALADVATVDAPNPYVESGETVAVPVRIAAHDGPVEGQLRLSTGFGANTAVVTVTLVGGDGPDRRVDVDERLAEPAPPDDESAPLDAVLARLPPGTLGVAGLAAVALATAAAATLVVGGTAGAVGFGVVFLGIVAAAALLAR